MYVLDMLMIASLSRRNGACAACNIRDILRDKEKPSKPKYYRKKIMDWNDGKQRFLKLKRDERVRFLKLKRGERVTFVQLDSKEGGASKNPSTKEFPRDH